MKDFYDKLVVYKSKNKLNYSDLGKIVNKSGDAFRMAVTRESFTDLEKAELSKLFENEKTHLLNEPETTYQQDLVEYNKELSTYKVKTMDELRDVAYKFLANEKELYEHHLLPDNREMHFWLRYKEIVDNYGSVDNYLQQEV